MLRNIVKTVQPKGAVLYDKLCCFYIKKNIIFLLNKETI